MKILFIGNRINNPITGGEIYNEALIQSAKIAGYEVIKLEGNRWNHIKLRFVRILWVNLYFLLKAYLLPEKYLVVLDIAFHTRFLLVLPWLKYIRRNCVIGVLHHYCFLNDEGRIPNKYHYYLEKYISSQLNYIIFNSAFTCRTFQELTHKKLPYTILSPFSIKNRNISLSTSNFSSEKIQLLHVGTLEERKNIINVLNAVVPLKIDYTFNMIGHFYSEIYLNKILKIIKDNNLENNVLLKGRVDDCTLDNYYKKSNIFILVSKIEGYGMAYAEAMHYGLPIIGSTTGAVPELVENEINGFLCDPEKPEQITDAVLKLTDRTIWNRFHQNNLKKASTLMDRETFILHGKRIFERFRTD